MESRKIQFDSFVKDDHFELNSYLTHLFELIYDYFPEQVEDGISGV